MISARRFLNAAATLVTAVALSLTTTSVTASAIPLNAPSGVDVADHQHPTLAGIDWNAVKSDGQSYAFVKATEGVGYINQFFVPDANAAHAAGLKVGAYHYARPSVDPARQAAAFAAQLALVPGQTLPPVLDLEVSEGKSPEELIAWTRVFTTELQRLTGRAPMIYTYRYFWTDNMANTTQFSEYPLWLAAYQEQAPAPVGGWTKLAFWQRSESGRVNGITGPVDMNLFNGTVAQLDTFSSGNFIDFGGIIEKLVIPGVNLSADSRALIAAILAIGVGLAVTPAAIDAAKRAGFGDNAKQFVEKAISLLRSGAISRAQLERMSAVGASSGDLAILLDNAEHLANVASSTDTNRPAGAAAIAPVAVNTAVKVAESRGINVHKFAGLVNSLLR